MIKFRYADAAPFLQEYEIANLGGQIRSAHDMLHQKSGAGSEFTGWVDLPSRQDPNEFARIQHCAEKIRENSQILIVIGIGGSYLGAKAAIEMMTGNFYNMECLKNKKGTMILFAGQNISSAYLKDLLRMTENYDVTLNVISKSGTTTEPAIAFRVLKSMMEQKYGKAGAAKRIIATTDAQKGALRSLAEEEGYETFVIPDDIGGRYSVLTPVGLLPIGAAGLRLDEIWNGAKEAYEQYLEPDWDKNPCYAYAAARNALYRKGKMIEILVNYEPQLHFITEWWKQLYGESEGKDQKGIFPAGVDFTTDLHSMGQYIQDGRRDLFETALHVEKSKNTFIMREDADDLDGLNFLAGKDLDYINKQAAEGTLLAHRDGGVPNLRITLPALDERSFGSLVYFFEKACGISGYLLGVNPFNQPGVEAYKKHMFRLLGKPGY